MTECSPETVKTTIRDRIRWKWQGIKWWMQRNIRNRLIRMLGGVPSGSSDSNYLSHAIREFDITFPDWRDGDMQEMICNNVLDLLRVFGSQGHSGSSAPYAINLAKKLLMFEPISPLTGEDSEWNYCYEQDGETVYQNKRCSSVFKNGKGGVARWSDGIIHRYPSGTCYSGSYSKVDIKFPWTKPDKPEYVDVDEEGNVLDNTVKA